jgi:hypothetical protein
VEVKEKPMSDAKIETLKKRIAELLVRSSFSEDPFHSVNTHEWVLMLMPDADEALQIAALGHDIERADERRRVKAYGYDSYREFKEAHALNSAQILAELMEGTGIDEHLTGDVARLVAHHEFGGDLREEVLKNADTLSFFQVCLPLYFDRHGSERTRKRLVWGYRKLPSELRRLVTEMEFMDLQLEELVRMSTSE